MSIYVMAPSIVVETVFNDILRMVFYIDFNCGSINFHKQIFDIWYKFEVFLDVLSIHVMEFEFGFHQGLVVSYT